MTQERHTRRYSVGGLRRHRGARRCVGRVDHHPRLDGRLGGPPRRDVGWLCGLSDPCIRGRLSAVEERHQRSDGGPLCDAGTVVWGPTALAIAALVVIAVPLAILVSAMAIGWVVSVSPTCSSATRSAVETLFLRPLRSSFQTNGSAATETLAGSTRWSSTPGAPPRITIAHSSCLGSQWHGSPLRGLRGPRALRRSAGDRGRHGSGSALRLDKELQTWVEDQLEMLATDNELVGDPTVSIVDEPYAGRELR